MSRIIELMKHYYAPTLIEDGQMYHEQGMVKIVGVDGFWVHGLVEEKDREYEVSVNIDRMANSRCACLYENYCSHITALGYSIRDEELENPPQWEEVSIREVERMIMDMSDSRETVPGIVKRLIRDKPYLFQYTNLIINRQENSKDREYRGQRVVKIFLQYYRQIAPIILKECQILCVEEDSIDGWEEGYGPGQQKIAKKTLLSAFKELHRYGDSFLKMITENGYISGTMALLVITLELDMLKKSANTQGCGSQFQERYSDFEIYLYQALHGVKEYGKKNLNARDFLQDIVDAIILHCKMASKLFNWLPLLKVCVVDLQGFYHLRERILSFDEDPFHIKRLDKKIKKRLIYWWVDLSLTYHREDEALAVVGNYLYDGAIGRLFFRYYYRNGQHQKVKEILEKLELKKLLPADYEWLWQYYQKKGDIQDQKRYLKRWFLDYPQFHIFKEYATRCEEEDLVKIINQWQRSIFIHEEVFIDILVFLGEIEEAWENFFDYLSIIFLYEARIISLLELSYKWCLNNTIFEDDEDFLYPNVFEARTHKSIDEKIEEFRDLCFKHGKEKEWTVFYHKRKATFKDRLYLLMKAKKRGYC